uniref:C-CAP/cofactor C-like domain-containing protein n=1 Tax=Onchocerca volvulus TaxID=6282 RepID=A0A8R1TTH7_ONCVO
MSMNEKSSKIDVSQCSGEYWMSNLPEEVTRKPLVCLAIPGSHDSFTHLLFDKYPVANDEGRFIREIGRFRLVRRFIRRWAITQRFSVTKQLYAGVRYFDIRLTIPLSTKLNGVRVLHALYGDCIEQLLLYINIFLDAHPREIVILDFNHLYNFNSNEYIKFLEMVENVFGRKLCLRGKDITKISLASMWQLGYQVITISAAETTTHQSTSWIWDSSCIISPYANVDRNDKLVKFLNRTLRDHRQGPRNVFFVTQAILTVKWYGILMHPFSTLEERYALKCTEKTISWITTFDEPSYFNIIICDFINHLDFCKKIISLVQHHRFINLPFLMLLRSCCPISKRSKREEQYHIKNDSCGNYSWDKEKSDPEQYRFVDLCDEIAIKSNGHIAGEQFIIERCKECCILLLDHLAAVNIDDCEECFIVIGPCKGSVFIRDCKNIALFTICQQFRSRDCSNIDVFLFCTTKPIIESSKLMRFRSLALSYDKLEEHITKASLSPFTNNWSNVHDFTPEDVSNFEICCTEYDQIKKMDIVKDIENIQFIREQSVLPLYTIANNAIGKDFDNSLVLQKMLILCMERANEALLSFYDRILKFLRKILAQGAQLITTKDMIIRKKELPSSFISKYIKSSGRLVTLEIAWNEEEVKRNIRMASDTMKVVEDRDFEHYRANLYRFAQMQTEIC